MPMKAGVLIGRLGKYGYVAERQLGNGEWTGTYEVTLSGQQAISMLDNGHPTR